MTYYAKWEAVKYTVNYYAADGVTSIGSGYYTIENATIVTDVTLPTASKGHEIAWSDYTLTYSDTAVKIVAIETAKKYTITFKYNNNTEDTAVLTDVEFGSNIDLTDVKPTYEGMTFDGWLYNGEKVAISDLWSEMSDGDEEDLTIELTAQWKLNEEWTDNY